MDRSQRTSQWIDDLPKRNVIYPNDFNALVEDYKKNPRFIANGECARLPQELTDVGWTGRWHRGPRVLDLAFLLPGTVIANFKLIDGHWKYPNEHGYHAGGRVMKTLLFAALLMSCAGAAAQTYRCPTRYPSNGTPAAALSNAAMYLGEKHGDSALHGDIEEVKDGIDTHYSFPDDVPKWLVCQYGGERIPGSAISGTRVVGGRDWWIPLDLLIEACDLKIREETPDRGASQWSAVASCKSRTLPPPVMLE